MENVRKICVYVMPPKISHKEPRNKLCGRAHSVPC